MMVRKMSVVALLGVVVLVMTGCSKLTLENWQMIKVGASTKLEVENTLGKANSIRGDEWKYEDEDRNLDVSIKFDASDKVAKKEWIDAGKNEWFSEPSEPSEGRRVYDESNTQTIHKD
jgi:hypothetical protein